MRTLHRTVALLGGSLALIAIWSYSPAPPAEHHIVVNSAQEAARLPPGSPVLLEGVLVVPPGDSSWHGYPVFQHAERAKDYTGDRVLPVRAERRPAVTIRTRTDELHLAPQSYSLRHAPRISPTRWYRREEENRGFRPNAPVVAVGSVSAASTFEVSDLAIGPLSVYRHERASAMRSRYLLSGGLRLGVTMLVATFMVGALFHAPKRPTRREGISTK